MHRYHHGFQALQSKLLWTSRIFQPANMYVYVRTWKPDSNFHHTTTVFTEPRRPTQKRFRPAGSATRWLGKYQHHVGKNWLLFSNRLKKWTDSDMERNFFLNSWLALVLYTLARFCHYHSLSSGKEDMLKNDIDI